MTQPETVRRSNNRDRVLSFLQSHREATNVELLEIGGIRYGGRIFELRQQGHRIETAEHRGGVVRYLYLGHVVPGQQALAF